MYDPEGVATWGLRDPNKRQTLGMTIYKGNETLQHSRRKSTKHGHDAHDEVLISMMMLEIIFMSEIDDTYDLWLA